MSSTGSRAGGAAGLAEETVNRGRDAGSYLADVVHSRENNFDVLRLAAAALVLVSHSFALTGRHEPLDPHTLGTAGVEIFFAISGFLVAKSWFDDARVGRFLLKRALRIFPGLLCAVTVTALVIGAAFTTAPESSYFASGQVWDYIVGNTLLVPQWLLPGVFTDNPVSAANGSLWTLPLEFQCYLFLLLVAAVGFLRRRAVVVAAIALTAANAFLRLTPSVHLFSIFVAGSALYVLRDSVKLRGDIAVALLALWLAAYTTSLAPSAGMIALPYLAAFGAYRSPKALRRLTSRGDVSYGAYVYAFPFQQAIVAVAGPVAPVLLIAAAAPLVWLAGFASWHLVERPMLKQKYRRLIRETRETSHPGKAVQAS